MNVVIIGFMGSGKTTVGKALAEKRNMKFLDFDEAIEAHEGRSISEIFTEKGEDYFRACEAGALSRAKQLDNHVFATGGGMVLAQENQAALKALGKIVWLDVSFQEAFQRTFHEKNRPLIENGNRETAMNALWAPRQDAYKKLADVAVNVNGKNTEQIVKEIEGKL